MVLRTKTILFVLLFLMLVFAAVQTTKGHSMLFLSPSILYDGLQLAILPTQTDFFLYGTSAGTVTDASRGMNMSMDNMNTNAITSTTMHTDTGTGTGSAPFTMTTPSPPEAHTRTHTTVSGMQSKSNSMAGCLLIMDDNFRLYEWLAYHYTYHVLPLQCLIVAVDPLSKTSPEPVIEIIRQELNMGR